MKSIIPDPNNRSVNNPYVTLSKKKAVKIYNADTDSNMTNCTQKVKEYIEAKNLEKGWAEVAVTSGEFIFKADVRVNNVNSSHNTKDNNNSNVVPIGNKKRA